VYVIDERLQEILISLWSLFMDAGRITSRAK